MMVFGEVFQSFLDAAPACVMVRATMEQVFAPDKLNAVFTKTAVEQYTRELMFSTVVDVMSGVVCRIHPSVHAAYTKKRAEIPVSIKAVYDKLQHIEAEVSRGLVCHTACEVSAVIEHLKGQRRPVLEGYRCRIMDGNHLTGSEHRLSILRDLNTGALPGFALAVLDPDLGVIADIFPCEDAHTQECSLLEAVLPTVNERDLWICDRHFCTSQFLFGLAGLGACFAQRQHLGHLVWRRTGRQRFVGHGPTGKVYEQAVILTHPKTGEQLTVRRITVKLKQPTRDGDLELHLFTNLPETVGAIRIAEIYRTRWRLETAFHDMTVYLNCELNTLGYPAAALFGFCVATASYNIFAVVKAALRAAHGEETVEEKVSDYFLTEEISSTYRGMLIGVPPKQWKPFGQLTARQFAKLLYGWAKNADLSAYPKHKRGPKKPAGKRRPGTCKHVATKRLLESACNTSTA